MDFRNFTTYAAERRRAGAILGTPPPVDGKRTGVHHWGGDRESCFNMNSKE